MQHDIEFDSETDDEIILPHPSRTSTQSTTRQPNIKTLNLNPAVNQKYVENSKPKPPTTRTPSSDTSEISNYQEPKPAKQPVKFNNRIYIQQESDEEWKQAQLEEKIDQKIGSPEAQDINFGSTSPAENSKLNSKFQIKIPLLSNQSKQLPELNLKSIKNYELKEKLKSQYNMYTSEYADYFKQYETQKNNYLKLIEKSRLNSTSSSTTHTGSHSSKNLNSLEMEQIETLERQILNTVDWVEYFEKLAFKIFNAVKDESDKAEENDEKDVVDEINEKMGEPSKNLKIENSEEIQKVKKTGSKIKNTRSTVNSEPVHKNSENNTKCNKNDYHHELGDKHKNMLNNQLDSFPLTVSKSEGQTELSDHNKMLLNQERSKNSIVKNRRGYDLSKFVVKNRKNNL